MMKYLIPGFALFCMCLNLTISAQPAEIVNIRETYNEYNKLIEQQGDDSSMELPLKIDIDYTITERAVGPVNYHITFYYDRIELNQADYYSDQYVHILRKVVYSQESVWQMYKEFMFNSEGELIFCYEKSVAFYPCKEQRYYFSKNKLIRVIFAENPDFLGDSVICNSGTRDTGSLTPEDFNTGEEILEQARKYMAMFLSIQ